MSLSILPANEAERLQTLARYGIMDTPAEQNFDDLAHLAASACRVPVALITFVAADRQWFKSAIGTDLRETCREGSFCQHTILQEEPLIVPDARLDARFNTLDLVTGAPFVRFYAGVPLLSPDGSALGSLCVLDFTPRELEEQQLETLQVLARQVMTLLELRRAMQERENIALQLHDSESRLRLITDTVPALISYIDPQSRYQFNNRGYEHFFAMPRERLRGRRMREMVSEETYAQIEPHVEGALNGRREEFETAHIEDGKVQRYTHSTYVPDVDENGEVRGFVALVQDITQRKRQARQLEESEQRYRSLFDFNPDAVYSFDLKGAFTSANTACETLTGYTRDELFARNFRPLIVPEHWVRTQRHFALAAQGKAQHYETAIIHRDGERVEIGVTKLPIVVDGQITGVFGIARDITPRVRAETELRRATQQISNIFESITDAVVAFDHNLHYVFVNARAESLLKKSASELLGRYVWDVYPYDETDVGYIGLNQALKTGQKVQWEKRWSPNGEWVEATAYPSRDGISVYFRVITERKLLEEATANQEKWLRQVLDMMPVPIFFIEPGTAAVIFANRAALQIAGDTFSKARNADEYEALYFVADKNGRRLTKDEHPGIRLSRGERLEAEQFIWTVNGTPHSVLISGDNLPAAHGQNSIGVLVLQDISQITAIENELREASRLKDEFLATVSHELRTPLTAIIGWTHLLRTQKLEENFVTKALETIDRNSRAQSQLIEDLLDVSRIITGNLRLETHRIEPSLIIENAVESVRPAANAKGVNVQTLLDPNAGTIQGDPDRLQQIVWNLLSNAVKFTPRDGWVRILSGRVGSHLEIVVSDSGQGIEAEFLPHVFDRFRQADGASTRAYGGLGLGLAITRHLVELHGGTITVQSAGLGQGSTFTVSLPLMIADALPELLSASPTALDATDELPDSHFDLQDLRVLVVDDETDTRELLVLVLQESGARVHAVGNARDALQVLATRNFDVLLSDIGMPGTDGYSMIKQIRALPTTPNARIPAIALTAYARTEDRLRALSAGFQAHIAKPPQPLEIVAVIASLSGRTGN